MGVRFEIVAAVALVCSVVAGHAEVLSCEGIPVTVIAPNRAIAEQTCRAAKRTVPVIAHCGVVLADPLKIEVRDLIPDAPDCMGVYHCGESRIEILSPASLAQLRRDDGAFQRIPTTRYFDSILTHEIAHAAYDAVPCPYRDCLVTSEYVAYAMQVYAMAPSDRQLFEADMALGDAVSRYDISAIGLLMAPDTFARNVWAHFSQRDDGCAYVADMMGAKFYLDTERP